MKRSAIVFAAGLLAGLITTAAVSVHAEQQAAIDRAIVERLVRAEEAQVRALERLSSTIERKR